VRKLPFPLVFAVLSGVVIGLAASATGSAASILSIFPAISRLPTVHVLEPARALPRTSMVMALTRAEHLLDADRPWAAWQALEPFLGSEEETRWVVLVAARAAYGWGGWQEVHELLAGQPWLDRVEGGVGRLLLAHAEEKLGRWSDAASSYGIYAARTAAHDRGIAEGKRAMALLRAKDANGAAAAFRAAATELPAIGDWLLIGEVEARSSAGSPHAAGFSAAVPMSSSAARMRWARAGAAAALEAGDTATAVQRLEREMVLLAQQRAQVEAATLALEWAPLVAGAPQASAARERLRVHAMNAALPASLRVRAADQLGWRFGPLTPEEEFARAAAYESAGRAAQAARALRASMSVDSTAELGTRFRLARLLFEAGDNQASRAILTDILTQLAGDDRAEAELMAARARFRAGDRAGGLSDLRRLAEVRKGSPSAGTALFLLGDAAGKIEDAIPLYRRAAATEAPEAREALHRLGDRRLRTRDTRGAIDAWEELVRRFPRGEATARTAFEVGLLNERNGRHDGAKRMFEAAMEAEPLSYYAHRAGERIGADPLDRVLADPRPWVGLSGEPAEAREVLGRLELLRSVGMDAEWKDELDAAIRRFDRRPLALVTLAEGLRDAGEILEGVRLARRMVDQRGGDWDGRLLRVAFPLPYRELLEREADRYGVDALLYAGLVRQESMFRADVKSRVGAAGLAQIMPATGRWIAPRVELPASTYRDELLDVPEINLRMGALYLRDLLRRYDGHADLALAGYNAGPARADRWRRELHHARDIDAFREAIPFDETRNYVKIVLRNAAVYTRLYGEVAAGSARSASSG
jgi:soluble lytic murein transglycosylase